MAGILYVVATPIGNLEDVTLRALRILRDVSLIAAEDTRRTARLLQHYSISTRTTSLHEHNEREKSGKLVERLLAGDSIALVSDAGTPIVSDPGQALVAAAREAGIRVEPIPGASAVMAAVSASGLPAESFVFLGFPPSRSKDRKHWVETLGSVGRLVVFFEAPHRIHQTLSDLAAHFGPDHVIGVGRELTKAHEELVVRPINVLLGYFAEPKGEFTVLVPPAAPSSAGVEPLPEAGALRCEIGELTNNPGSGNRAALKTLAAKYGVSVNELYRLINTDAPKRS
jgi:16S rRNA (cytidine1402-2'-O)-methyltransferase